VKVKPAGTKMYRLSEKDTKMYQRFKIIVRKLASWLASTRSVSELLVDIRTVAPEGVHDN
jgi:hypothetical protein